MTMKNFMMMLLMMTQRCNMGHYKLSNSRGAVELISRAALELLWFVHF